MRGRGVIVYWVGIRDKAVWLTLYDYYDRISLYWGYIYALRRVVASTVGLWAADKSRYGLRVQHTSYAIFI